MSDAIKVIEDLLSDAPFCFLGTVVQTGAMTMDGIPVDVDALMTVVHIDYVLQADPAFADMKGQRITVHLRPEAGSIPVGDQFAFFVQGLVFSKTILAEEIGRLTPQAVAEHVNAARKSGTPANAFSDLLRQLRQKQLDKHMHDEADAVVRGQVVRLQKQKASRRRHAEHDPVWWHATIEVRSIMRVVSNTIKGNIGNEVTVLFANSYDVTWRTAPKPQPGQLGVWMLHSTTGDLDDFPPFQILHSEDYLTIQEFDVLRKTRP